MEAKKRRQDSIVSLEKFRQKFSRFVFMPYVVHCKDLKEADGVVYLPLYMVPLLVSNGFHKGED